MITPFDVVVSRLDSVIGSRPKGRAHCPVCEDATGHRRHSLAWNEAADGTLFLRCFRGCANDAIMPRLGLQLANLFPPRPKREVGARSSFVDDVSLLASAPMSVVNDSLQREIDRRQAAETERLGYEPPLTSRIINAARKAVGKRYSRILAPVQPEIWERCGAHGEDPLWPVLFERALEEETRERWHFLYPDAPVGAMDPCGYDAFDILRAESRAVAQLRRIARDQRVA